MKLIKVIDGLYRNRDGSVVVSFQLKHRGEPAHWVVRYTSIFGAEVKKKFRTLADAKASLKEHSFN